MRFLGELFSKRVKNEEPEDLMEIAKVIGPLIDDAAKEIFASYQMKLLTEPLTYIIPAVWGAKKDGELTPTQKEISRQIVPVIEQIIQSLRFKELTGAQEFAIGFLVRGLIISKTTYMIEVVKNRIIDNTDSRQHNDYGLEQLEPVGTA
jgi:hypothetical protein